MLLTLLRYGLGRALHGRVDVRARAAESFDVSPAITTVVPPAVFDPRELRKVVAAEPGTTLRFEMRAIRGGPVHHAATRVHVIRDAVLHGAHVYAGGSRARVSADTRLVELRPGRARRIPRALMSGSVHASRYFGHFVREQLTAELLARELGVPACSSRRQATYRHESAIRAVTGLLGAKLGRARFDEIWLVEDHGQNESKCERYRALRAALRAGTSLSRPRGAFIKRGTTGARRALLNEAEITDLLDREGFAIVDPDRDRLSAIRRVLRDAPIVVGVEGSALANALLISPDRARLLVIQPPDRFCNIYKGPADCLGFRYGFTVADPGNGGFVLQPAQLLRAIDRMEDARASAVTEV